jgi:hypothetical protein
MDKKRQGLSFPAIVILILSLTIILFVFFVFVRKDHSSDSSSYEEGTPVTPEGGEAVIEDDFVETGQNGSIENNSVETGQNNTNPDEFFRCRDNNPNITDTSLKMLIFVSPQYKDDINITNAINGYINAVREDIGWETEVIGLDSEKNDFRKIDGVIEEYYNQNNITACIMVGEDINTLVGSDSEDILIEDPSTTPWATTGGEFSEQDYLDSNRPLTDFVNCYFVGSSHINRINIAISLLYPTHDLDYETKSNQIVTAFEKFSRDRNKRYSNNIKVFLSPFVSEVEQISINYSGLNISLDECEGEKEVYGSLEGYGNLDIAEAPNLSEVNESLDREYMMYSVFGHANPSFTTLNEGVYFKAAMVDNLKTPLLTVGGCNVAGWFTNSTENGGNGILDFSTKKFEWFGSKIFVNPNLRVMVLGFPEQSASKEPCKLSGQNFIQQAMPGLMEGKTISESIVGPIYNTADDQILYGDPTFHY